MRGARRLTLLLCLLVAGCSSALDRARQTIGTAATLERSTGEMVIEIDRDTQQDIADALGVDHDLAKAKAARDDWRGKRTQIRQALKTVHAAVVSASVTAELVAQGQRIDLGAAVVSVTKALVALKDALGAFGIRMPGGIL